MTKKLKKLKRELKEFIHETATLEMRLKTAEIKIKFLQEEVEQRPTTIWCKKPHGIEPARPGPDFLYGNTYVQDNTTWYTEEPTTQELEDLWYCVRFNDSNTFAKGNFNGEWSTPQFKHTKFTNDPDGKRIHT